jgi:3-methylfumaryl-CoA hydratase
MNEPDVDGSASGTAERVSVAAFPVFGLAAIFDDGLPAPASGQALPPCWHWAACEIPTPSGDLGKDGHPAASAVHGHERGIPRRMFAGGRVRFEHPLLIGDEIMRTRRLTNIVEKTGRTGPLRFVTQQTRLYTPAGLLAVDEEIDIVYRAQPPRSGAASTQAEPAARIGVTAPFRVDQTAGTAVLQPDSTALHRFAAATSNAHRIHYDYRYAREVEGHADLVVQGPFILLAVLELARLQTETANVRTLSFRIHRPSLVNAPIRLAVRPTTTVEWSFRAETEDADLILDGSLQIDGRSAVDG